ncbi:MAG: nitroreductase family protein [Lachnoclostridium sp.]|nr:nitroreductase family protein [Lachnoclostridium sp.]
MNSFHELIVNRRSIRRFKEQEIPSDDVTMILQAGLLAPTSKSSRSWQFIAVEDKDMLTRLSECKPAYATAIARCPLAIVVTADSTKSDAWIEDASVAATFIQLQAQDLGLTSCWIQVRGRYAADGRSSEEYIQDALGIPETCTPVCVIAIGYADEERKPQNLEKLNWDQVHVEKF